LVLVMDLHIDVVSVVICPWCYIGKRRLEKAIAMLDGTQAVRVRWLPFQLNSSMPKEGIERREYRTKKFDSWEYSQQLDAKVAAVGEAEGIHFAFDRIGRTPNTLAAHRLIWLADKHGIQDAVAEALFNAYFTEGSDITSRHTLVDVVATAGIDRHQATAVLDVTDGLDAINEVAELARRFRVEGVPFFIVNGTAVLSGAQPAEEFLEVFRQVG
jgi:predicted DsbA family dithiol-disulfide isomerase